MVFLRSFDTFVKPRDDLRTRSALGGFITMVAAAAASLLFLAQVYLYTVGSPRHSLSLAESTYVPLLPQTIQQPQDKSTRVPLNVHVTFPHIPCGDLDCSHDNAHYSTGDFQRLHGTTSTLKLRHPSLTELENAGYGGIETSTKKACTVQGTLFVPKVGGTFAITVSQQAWQRVTSVGMFGGHNVAPNHPHLFNVSHYVHSITFGEPFPLASHPLEKVPHIIENQSGGVGLSNVNVRLVPTRYKRFFSESNTFQASVTEHLVQPQTLAAHHSRLLPGLALTYDFSPLEVHYVEHRESFLVFLSSLVSIVGGVFVTVALATGCLVHSAAAVAKKKD